MNFVFRPKNKMAFLLLLVPSCMAIKASVRLNSIHSLALAQSDKPSNFVQIDGPCRTVSGPKIGEECAFPFKFEGKTYEACVKERESLFWCPTLSGVSGEYAKAMNFWGYCGMKCLPPTSPPGALSWQNGVQTPKNAKSGCQRMTEQGFACEIPFIFKSVYYDDCAKVGAVPGKFWCPTSKDAQWQANRQYGYCKPGCNESVEVTTPPFDTYKPTAKPTDKEEPTGQTTAKPYEGPTAKPYEVPTNQPTAKPYEGPTAKPYEGPTAKPYEGPTKEPNPCVDFALRERTFNGECNSLADATCGAVGQIFTRLGRNSYWDGIGSKLDPGPLPSARVVSMQLMGQGSVKKNAEGLSSLVWQWGQFIDHDLTATFERHTVNAPPQSKKDTYIVETSAQIQDPEFLECTEATDIEVPTGDQFLDRYSTRKTSDLKIDQCRSAYIIESSKGPQRQTKNFITSWLDGSGVYGLQYETPESCKLREYRNPCLRSFSQGLMRSSKFSDGGEALPKIETVSSEGWEYVAGDGRVNEQPGLTAMHTLWVREHNTIARRISKEYGIDHDETLFNLARNEVIAEIQAITYNEWLPALLGERYMPDYKGYVQPKTCDLLTTEFSTAIFRFGHSMVPDELLFLKRSEEVEDYYPLPDVFFAPRLVDRFGIDGWLNGLRYQVAEQIDLRMVDGLRNLLFNAGGFPNSFAQAGRDLGALNIERGRDHGLTPVNAMRNALGLPKIKLFTEVVNNYGVAQTLADLYGVVDTIDPIVHLLAEDHVPGAAVGDSLRALLKFHFQRLRDSDRYWYENMKSLKQDLPRLRATTLGQVIERNTKLYFGASAVFYSDTQAFR
eukprot:gb/GEZN01002263.1/.p1 GENE.gb/GEZN01002263.1/~~gb/GEZN01002263.1/.p1  ORF type:complete len:837 (-),score=51.33 gb/GEZN01002263.1/:7-2517(-)